MNLACLVCLTIELNGLLVSVEVLCLSVHLVFNIHVFYLNRIALNVSHLVCLVIVLNGYSYHFFTSSSV